MTEQNKDPHWILKIMFTERIARAIEQDWNTDEKFSVAMIVLIMGLAYTRAIFALFEFVWKAFT